jgi:hypothetical protein
MLSNEDSRRYAARQPARPPEFADARRSPGLVLDRSQRDEEGERHLPLWAAGTLTCAQALRRLQRCGTPVPSNSALLSSVARSEAATTAGDRKGQSQERSIDELGPESRRKRLRKPDQEDHSGTRKGGTSGRADQNMSERTTQTLPPKARRGPAVRPNTHRMRRPGWPRTRRWLRSSITWTQQRNRFDSDVRGKESTLS